MALTTLKDDLLAEFREECVMIREQMEILDPLGTALRKPAAQRLLSTTTLIITEILCYGLFAGGIGLMVMMPQIYPFSVGNTLYHSAEMTSKLGNVHVNNFLLAGYGITGLAVILFMVIGRMARAIRLKNEILHSAGKDIKTIIGMHLERKAAIDTLEQRHMLDVTSGIFIPGQHKNKTKINDIANPGYDEEEIEMQYQQPTQQQPRPQQTQSVNGNTVTWKM